MGVPQIRGERTTCRPRLGQKPRFTSAGDLSRTYTAKSLTRSVDLLHVAAARMMMCSTFASADDRQLAVAKATGLEVVDIKRRARRKKS